VVKGALAQVPVTPRQYDGRTAAVAMSWHQSALNEAFMACTGPDLTFLKGGLGDVTYVFQATLYYSAVLQ
jgi:hypothetical protein